MPLVARRLEQSERGDAPASQRATHGACQEGRCKATWKRDVSGERHMGPAGVVHTDTIRVGWPLVRSHEERICSILGPTQSRISPSILVYEEYKRAVHTCKCVEHSQTSWKTGFDIKLTVKLGRRQWVQTSAPAHIAPAGCTHLYTCRNKGCTHL